MTQHYFHITARTIDQKPFEQPLADVWASLITNLRPKNICAVVLMHNHYHLLLQSEAKSIFPFLYELHRELNINLDEPLLQFLSTQKQIKQTYRYIYQNPVRANLVTRAQDYSYSTLHYLYVNKPLPLPIHDLKGILDEYKLSWINQKIA